MTPAPTRFRAALVVVLFAVVSRTHAQDARHHVTQVIGATTETHDIAVVDARTFLATSGGLVVREAGRSLRALTARDGLPGARSRSLSVTPAGLWVGGLEGAALVEPRTLDVKRALPLRRVRRVVEWQGARWFAGYGGLHREPLPAGEPAAVSLGASHARERLTDALAHGDGLWIASAGAGVMRLDASGRVLGRLTRGRGLPDDTVHALARHGELVLVGTLGGLAVVRDGQVVRNHPLARSAERLPVRDVRAILVDDAAVHVVTFGAGVFTLDAAGRAPTSRAPSDTSEAIREGLALARTPEGILVGHRAGVHRADGRGRLVALSGGGLPSADVTALARAFGALYVGTFDRGLAKVHRDGRVEDLGAQLRRWNVDARINDLAVTRRGGERLWLATDRGLHWHDGRRFVPVDAAAGPGRAHVTSLHVDARGDLWVTSSRVLARWRGDDEAWERWGGDARFPVMQLHAVQTLGDEVWVGSLHGLFRLDPRDGSFERHTVSSGALPVDWVTALASVGDALVVGTYHGGLAWRRGDAFVHEREGRAPGALPAGWVNPHAITIHRERVYIGTLERGLVVGARGAWAHYTTRDGLPSDDVTAVLVDGDDLWVGTRGGLARLR
ncbi:MAG: hypothetical protein KF901_16990 [Myxococcales bacterium]|nr:hypothetical protein [Myxococcales bacterium]